MKQHVDRKKTHLLYFYNSLKKNQTFEKSMAPIIQDIDHIFVRHHYKINQILKALERLLGWI